MYHIQFSSFVGDNPIHQNWLQRILKNMVEPFLWFNLLELLFLHAILFTHQKSESTSLLISVSFWLIYTYQSRVSTFQKLPIRRLLRYCSSWAFDFLTIMSVIQVANQIIMFLTPTYILDHILPWICWWGVSQTQKKNNKK